MSEKPTRDRVRDVLEREVAGIDSPERAEEVAARLEALAADKTEQTEVEDVARERTGAATAVEQAATGAPPGPDEAAAVIAKAAAEAVALSDEAPDVQRAAHDAFGPGQEAAGRPAPAEVERGRSLLRQAILHHMGPLHRVDAGLYLAINGWPHPEWSDRLANTVTVWTTGGWLWAGAVLVARLTGVPRSGRALIELLPSMMFATWSVEFPIKALFRRQRPFIDNVRALVVGKKPGSWSFPSGHTASSFACAWVLSTVWQRWAPLYLALASCVGFSRVYVGAHYPGDVASGALIGMALSELARQGTRAVLAWRRR